MITPNELYLQELRTKRLSIRTHLDKYEHVVDFNDVDIDAQNRYKELRRQLRVRLSEIETDIAMAERNQTNETA